MPVAKPNSIYPGRVCLCFGLLLLAGCGKSSAPVGKLIPVQGLVTLNSQPFPDDVGGEVLFVPMQSNDEKRPVSRGKIVAGGSYTLKTAGKAGAPEGSYRAVVLPGNTKPLAGQFPPIYSNQKMSPLQVEVVENKPAGGYELHLTPGAPH